MARELRMKRTMTRETKQRARNGSVMLETVIAMPLFMTLIGGMLWIGELMHTKQALVVSDRYVAWNCGNRHRSAVLVGTNEVRNAFWRGDVNKGVVLAFPAGGPPQRWSWAGIGGVGGIVTLPLWLAGWVNMSDIMAGKTTVANQTDNLLGRDIPQNPMGYGYEGHQVVMRSGNDGTRNLPVNANAALTINWSILAVGERWPSQYLPTPAGDSPLWGWNEPCYVRDGNFVAWSK